MNRFAIAGVILATLMTQGCAYFTKPIEIPVIEEKLNRSWMNGAAVGTLSLTPERRVVLVNFSNNRFCAEAPTEIGIDLSSISELAAQAAAGTVDKVTLDAKLAQSLSSKNAVLNKRTQGMQLFLANAYFTCQMYMNGGIDAAQMLEMQFQALQYATPLIEKELSLIYGAQGKPDEPAASKSVEKSDAIRSGAAQVAREVLKKQDASPTEAPKPQAPPSPPAPQPK